MKIGYDAKRFFLNNTGLGNYSRWLVKNVVEQYPKNQYLLYSPKIRLNGRTNFTTSTPHIKAIAPTSGLFKSWWRSKGIVKDLKKDGIEIYHGLSHELPIGIKQAGIRSAVTIHDLIVMRLPGGFGWINRKIYTAKLKYACKTADKIIAISQNTKDDLVNYLNIAAEKIAVVYQGIDPIFKEVISDNQKKEVKNKYALPSKFLLNVGTIEERKNLLLLVKALIEVADIPLVVVGKPTKYLDEVKTFINANALANRVIFLHNVEFAHLPAIYQLASVFIYPSRYEGFGLPVLEAISSGTPVIAATGSCLEEAGGPESLYVAPDDENDLAKKITLVLSDEALRENMIAKGLQYSGKFEATKLTAQLMEIYKDLHHA